MPPGRTRGTKWTEEGNSWPPTSFNSKFKSLKAGGVGPKQEGKVKAQSNLVMRSGPPNICQGPNLLQNRSWKGPTHRASHAAKGKAKVGYEDSELQRRETTVMRGSKKLWNVLLPSSSESRQGDRSREKPVTAERSPTGSDSLSVEVVAEVGSLLFQGGSEEGTMPTKEIEEQRNTPRVSAHLSSQPSLPLRYPFSGVAPPHQSPFEPDISISAFHSQFPMKNRVLTENCLKKVTMGIIVLGISPHGVPILGAVSKGVSDFSQTSGFQIEGLSPSKMAKVCEVLRSLDIKETKREVCDRRFVGSVWLVRNKEWAILPACGALGGILIIWDSKKMRIYGPNNPSIRKEFWVELSDLFGLTYPSWCVGGDFNVIRSRSEKLGGSGVTSSMRDFDGFIRESELHDPPLRNASFTWSNMQESPVCKRLDRFLYSNEWELSFPQSLQEFREHHRGDITIFQKLYSCPPSESWRVEGIDWSPISVESASRLDSPFAEAEIFNAIFQLDRDKAPGPDGFTIAIIAKVLSGRLRGVLQETIHSTQGAFVQGRQILDAVLIANEIVDEKKRSGEEGVVFKIDFEKAYNHVKWDFLDHVLEKKARGLRQGDPLSPFLFTIVADVLSRMLLKAEERNLLEGFRVGRNRCRVTHLQFADDTILFASPREEELQTLKSLLLVFGQISGLKVNLDKSNLFGINLDQNHLSRLALLLDCKASDWPILYLGLPLGGKPNCLWILGSRVGEGKRDHLVRWEAVCKPRIIGGLGIGKIPLRNRALLGKWLWRLFQLAKMDWVPPKSISDLMFINYKGFGKSKRGVILWQNASIALIWVVWRERNARIFEDKARNAGNLWDSIHFLASFWAFCSTGFKGTPLNFSFGGRISHPPIVLLFYQYILVWFPIKNVNDRKSTIGYCTSVWGNLITWRSKKQNVVARSSAKVEYRALAQGTCELIWLQRLLEELKIQV
ncbi:putative mitochondrial protein [Vitis vinifera]|uniref:Putative mitochondrial protein n=1 Tax=Vitis vinifera TaxID=29760 RepID=A0A438I0B4_VITVI|nr:putative mitochondrial protein [Vitis vinifera]